MLIDNNTTFPQKEPQIYFNSGLRGGNYYSRGVTIQEYIVLTV